MFRQTDDAKAVCHRFIAELTSTKAKNYYALFLLKRLLDAYVTQTNDMTQAQFANPFLTTPMNRPLWAPKKF